MKISDIANAISHLCALLIIIISLVFISNGEYEKGIANGIIAIGLFLDLIYYGISDKN